jgi:hypothetical protein
MTIGIDSQNFDSYVPVYDVAPTSWDEARPFIVEQLKVHANAINVREVGFFLDQELLSGKAFIPGSNEILDGGSSQQFRTILRIVVNVGPLIAGVNPPIPHGVTFDVNLTSIDSWVEATNSVTLTAVTLVYPALQIVGANILITSPAAFDRAFLIWEYIQEV